MTPAMTATLIVTVLATILLVGNWLRPDLVALLVLAVLGLSGLVTPEQALSGFSGSAVVTILGIAVIAEGLRQTGITYRMGQQMKRLAGGGEKRLLIVVMLGGAALSLFMNNMAAMAVLLPAALSLARQTRLPASRLMMPLSFGVIAGGMATLFTTSNLVVSGALRDAGLRPLGMLDFLPVGLPLVAVAVVYMLLVGRHLLPERDPGGANGTGGRGRADLLTAYHVEDSLWSVTVRPGSAMAGLSLQQGDWRNRVRLNVLAIVRGKKYLAAPTSGTILREGDLVIAQGIIDPKALHAYGLTVEKERPKVFESSGQDDSVAEILLSPTSALVGRTLREIHLRERSGLTVLAMLRDGMPIHIGFANLKLRVGDGLLVQGTVAALRLLYQERDFIVIDEDPEAVARPGRGLLAAALGIATLALAITGWLPIALVSLGGALAMVLAGCLSMDEAYRAVDWKAIALIAGLWPLSTAIQGSGLGQALVQGLLGFAGMGGIVLLTALLLLVTALLTNLMSGQSAAPIILAPIGLTLAQATGADARMFLMAIALGCSLSFPTPIGHPVNVMAMTAGGYTFRDFLRVGGPLVLLEFLAILAGLHFFWGL